MEYAITSRPTPQLRGTQLRSKILLAAKRVFLEAGYDRASMDAVAQQANTSKRSVYAHFENKESLFLAVLDLVRDLHLQTLGNPAAYGEPALDAVVAYCSRFLQLLVWQAQIRTARMAMAEAERLPQSTLAYFEAIFSTTLGRLAAYVAQHYQVDDARARVLAEDIIDRVVLRRLTRTLFSVEPPIGGEAVPSLQTVETDVDVAGIRRHVVELLSTESPL